MNFALIQHHKWSLSDVDNMICWEREVFLMLLMKHLEEERRMLEDLKKHRK